MIGDYFERAKKAAGKFCGISGEKINAALRGIADAIQRNSDTLIRANAADLGKMSPDDPKYDRLMMTIPRLDTIVESLRKIADMDDPTGRVLSHDVRPNGLVVERVSVPFGVIGIIYEARPNVTFDVSALCLKSGNVSLLKGSRDAWESNNAIAGLIRGVLRDNDIPEDAVILLPPDHAAGDAMMQAVGYVDLIIPRGGRGLIDYVRSRAKVPVIETGAGTCHIYFDSVGDTNKGARIIVNAKTRRVSVCNALDCLLVHSSRIADLPALCEGLSEKNVTIYADELSYVALQGKYPQALLRHAVQENYGKEYLDYAMTIKTVDSMTEAMDFISKYGSGHSESIITEDRARGESFLRAVDAACVYMNAPTSFSDGGQLGLGAEIGISTQKLHARGPMGLKELTTYKWVIRGNGQIRP